MNSIFFDIQADILMILGHNPGGGIVSRKSSVIDRIQIIFKNFVVNYALQNYSCHKAKNI